jgi:transcriptional regulator with XRE-family HTH domain
MPRQKRSTEYEKHSTVKVFDGIFSVRLAALIKKQKDSIGKAVLCEELAISKRTCELWENRKSRPDIDRVLELADYFGVSCDYLLGKSDHPTADVNERDIQKRFGLSPEAQANLKIFMEMDDADTVNALFVSEHFISGVINIRDCSSAYDAFQAAISRTHDGQFTMEKGAQGLTVLDIFHSKWHQVNHDFETAIRQIVQKEDADNG